MPDDVRIAYRPEVRPEPTRTPVREFAASNTSGLSSRKLAALNRALERLMATGLDERAAELAIDAAVREWLQPKDAGEADVDRLLPRAPP